VVVDQGSPLTTTAGRRRRPRRHRSDPTTAQALRDHTTKRPYGVLETLRHRGRLRVGAAAGHDGQAQASARSATLLHSGLSAGLRSVARADAHADLRRRMPATPSDRVDAAVRRAVRVLSVLDTARRHADAALDESAQTACARSGPTTFGTRYAPTAPVRPPTYK
jgi:hypothetical protein